MCTKQIKTSFSLYHGLLLALLSLTGSQVRTLDADPVIAGEQPVPTFTHSSRDLSTELRLYQAEYPVETTCAVGASSGLAGGLAAARTVQLLKLAPKGGPTGVVAGIGLGTLAAIEFGRNNLALLRSKQITELREIKTEAQDMSKNWRELVSEQGLVRGLITKITGIATKNETASAAELAQAQKLAEKLAESDAAIGQLGTDLTAQVQALEKTVSKRLKTAKSGKPGEQGPPIALSPINWPDRERTNSLVERGVDCGVSASIGLGAGAWLRGNPRVGLALTAAGLAATLGAGSFLKSYVTEVEHLRTGFSEIQAIKAAQAAQRALLFQTKAELATSKELADRTLRATSATDRQLAELAAKQAQSLATVEKFGADLTTSKSEVARALTQTQQRLLAEIARAEQARARAAAAEAERAKEILQDPVYARWE